MKNKKTKVPYEQSFCALNYDVHNIDFNAIDHIDETETLLKHNEELDFKIADLKLSNLVLTLDCGVTIDLKHLQKTLDAYKFTYRLPELFSGMSIKFYYNGCAITAILFKTGKAVLVGVKKHIPDIVTKIIKTLSYLVSVAMDKPVQPTLKVSNKVYSFSVGAYYFPKSLVDFYNTVGKRYIQYIEYNSAAFPGLTLRIPDSTAVFLIFNSRKCILTGGKKKDIVNADSFCHAVNFLKNIMQESRLIYSR